MKLFPFATDVEVRTQLSKRSFRSSQSLRLRRATISIQRNDRLCYLISLHFTYSIPDPAAAVPLPMDRVVISQTDPGAAVRALTVRVPRPMFPSFH